tara:strand:+ start:381 stop:1025 length:645 start_codon:yes stop_codon:yes gene_type:complete
MMVQRTRCIIPASRADLKPFLLGIHYAKRFPSISYAYGLDVDGSLEGVITYGTPPSATLRRGIAGEGMDKNVLELNRLCLKSNERNDASWLVAASVRSLSGDRIIVSFADTEHGHSGTVYQAANFLYTGLSAKRTDWKVRGKEHLHGQTIADEFRGQKNRADLMRAKYGDDFYLKPRSRKHRYVMIIGSKKFKKEALNSLRYKIQDYPKKGEEA